MSKSIFWEKKSVSLSFAHIVGKVTQKSFIRVANNWFLPEKTWS